MVFRRVPSSQGIIYLACNPKAHGLMLTCFRLVCQGGRKWDSSSFWRYYAPPKDAIYRLSVKITDRNEGVAARFIAPGWGYPRRGPPHPQRHKCRGYTPYREAMGCSKPPPVYF